MLPYRDDYESLNRRTLLDGVATLESTNQTLARTNQVAIETEQIGTEVISDLNDQRETLLRAKNRLTNADSELKDSRRLLKQMSHHILYNKLILIFIIVLEAGILGLTVYLKFFSK